MYLKICTSKMRENIKGIEIKYDGNINNGNNNNDSSTVQYATYFQILPV